MRRPHPEAPGPGQESVWDYPRPPRLERTQRRHRGGARRRRWSRRTSAALRVLETSHPPTYYLPRSAFADGALRPAGGGVVLRVEGPGGATSTCVGGDVSRPPRAAWHYPTPTPAFARARRPRRALPGGGGPVHGRRRGGAAAARRVLRRLGDVAGGRPVQGRARDDRPGSPVAAGSRARRADARVARSSRAASPAPATPKQTRAAGPATTAVRARPPRRAPRRWHRPAPGSRRARRGTPAGPGPVSTSRSIPPPMPVSIPISAAGTGPRPNASAFSAPVTQNSESPAASSTLTTRSMRPSDRVEEEGDQAGRRRHEEVAPVGERRRRHGADEHVAEEAAPEARRAGQHQHREHVELLADRDQGAGQREHEDAHEVQHDEQRAGVRDRRPACGPVCTSTRAATTAAACRRASRLDAHVGQDEGAGDAMKEQDLTLVGLTEDQARGWSWSVTRARSSRSPPTPGSGPPSAASTPDSASWRSPWRAPCDPATSSPGSGPARRPRASPPPPRPPSTR